MKKGNYEEFANKIVSLIGGEDNIGHITHCVTRLRFELKDRSRADIDEINKLDGVMGSRFSSGQYQIIIGPNVRDVYDEIIKQTGLEENIQENAIEEKQKFSFKNLGNSIITNLSGSITPILPIIICAGMIKMVVAVFGPSLIGWISEGSGLLTILNFAGDAGFYFLPIFLGYSSAKQFNSNPFIGMLMGAILIHPSFMAAVSEGSTLELFGQELLPVTYQGTVLPIIMITWIMSYLEKAFTKVVPDMFKLMFVPFLTIAVVLPLSLFIIAPLGSILGIYLSDFFLWIHTVLGPIGIGIIAVAFLPLVLTGMHHTINIAAMMSIMTVGHESVVLVAATASTMAVIGVILGFTAKAKKPENRALGISSGMLQVFGGIVEPALFGILLPHKTMFIAQSIGAFVGGTLMGFLGLKMMNLTGSNFLILAGYLGSDMSNFVKAVIASLIIIVFTFVVTYLLGFNEEKKKTVS